jgi:putative addiction module component (TIGR02574 family)
MLRSVMASDPSQSVLDEALRLSGTDRARIARELLRSLDEDEDQDEDERASHLDERALKAELDRRLDEVRTGKAQTMSVEQAQAFLAERRARRAR